MYQANLKTTTKKPHMLNYCLQLARVAGIHLDPTLFQVVPGCASSFLFAKELTVPSSKPLQFYEINTLIQLWNPSVSRIRYTRRARRRRLEARACTGYGESAGDFGMPALSFSFLAPSHPWPTQTALTLTHPLTFFPPLPRKTG